MQRLFILILSALVSTIGFAQQWHTTVDVLRRAPMQLPDSVRHLLVVNNMAVQPADFAHQTRVVCNEQDNTESVNIDIASLPLHALFGIEAKVKEAGNIRQVTIIDRSQCRDCQPFAKRLLTPAQVDSLCRLYDANAAICLNQYIVNDLLEVSCTWDAYQAELSVRSISSWSIHYPHQTKCYSYSQADTLVWQSEGTNLNAAFSSIVNREDAILDMAMYVGENVAQLFVPSWQTQDRYYYCNNDPRLLAGLQALQHCRWQQAREQWLDAANTSGNRRLQRQTRAYAMANLAALEEMQGNKSQAVSWARQAADAFALLGNAEGRQQQVNLLYLADLMQDN